MVVASAKDKATRKPLYPVAWDNDVLLMPRVNAKKQNRPTFTDKQVSQIVERAEGQYKVLFAVLAASGLRISELLGLRIENVLDDCYRLRIIEKNYAGRQEDRLKTDNAERIVELHSTAAQLLRSVTSTSAPAGSYSRTRSTTLSARRTSSSVICIRYCSAATTSPE